MTTLVNNAPPVVVVIEQRPPLVLTPTSNTGPGGGGDTGVVLDFPAPAMSWTINHNLGRKVDVALYTTGSVKMGAQLVLINDNQAVASFSQPTAGFARVI